MTLTYIVPPELGGTSLHNVLRKIGISALQTKIIKRTDSVRVDGESVFGNQPVFEGETIEVSFPEYEKRQSVPKGILPTPEILYEDEFYIVLFKPAGVQTHPSSTAPQLSDSMEERVMSSLGYCAHSCHRLDAETQGILFFAKFPYAQTQLQENMHSGLFRKEYEAWTFGIPKPWNGVIDAPLERRDPASFTRIVRPDGKPAQTVYTVMDTRFVLGQLMAHMRLCPITGRTHQLRAHMAYIGCPILGDHRYATPSQEIYQETNLIISLQLNARRVTFFHPFKQQWMTIESRPLTDPFWCLREGSANAQTTVSEAPAVCEIPESTVSDALQQNTD